MTAADRPFTTDAIAQLTTEPGTTKDAAFAFALRLATNSPDAKQPFKGYRFRIGSAQAAGVVLVAYPVEYGVSGVMTFIVLPGGSVYEKDLGSQINGKPAGDWAPLQ